MIALAAAMLLIVPPAAAQSRLVAWLEGAPSRRESAPISRDTTADVARGPAVNVEVLPGEFRVVQVPVPPALPQGGVVRFVVRSATGFRLLGPAAGTLPVQRPEVFLVTLSVADGVLAGPQEAGVVEFTAGDTTIVVPLVATVTAVHRATLRFMRPRVGVLSGERFTLEVVARNMGNVAETLYVDAALPTRWRTAQVTPSRVVIAPGAQAVASITGITPTTVGVGEFILVAQALNDSVSTSAEARIVVDPGRFALRSGSVPILGMSTTSIFTGDQTVTGGVLTFRGDVGRGTRLDALYVIAPQSSGAGQIGAARAGLIRNLGYVRLSDESWSLSAGPMGVPTLPLSGFGTFGQGVAGSLRVGNVTTSAGYAQSSQAQATGHPAPLVGARVDWQPAAATRWSMAGSHLRDAQGLRTRELDALAVEWEQSSTRELTRAGLAYRSSVSGSGLAAELGMRRGTDARGYEVQLAHVPGGSQAFARATDDIQVSGYWGRLGRMPWSGGAYLQRDRSVTADAVTAAGFSVGPQFELNGATTLDASLRGRAFTNVSENIRSGTREFEASSGIQHRVRSVFLGATVSTGVLTSVLRPVNAPDATAMVGRTAMRASAGTSLPFAQISTNAVVQWTGRGIGVPTQQRFLSAQVSEVPIWPLASIARFHARFATNSVAGSGSGVSSALGGITVRIASRLGIVFEAERNTISAGLPGGSPWITYLKLTSDVPVPLLRAMSRGTSGVVYQDLNANGRRDEGEPPVSGIVLTSGTESVASDTRGRFSFASVRKGDVRLDVRSLPLGFVASRSVRSAGEVLEFGIVPTSTLTARIVLGVDAFGRRVELPMDRFVIVATDATSREWRTIVSAEGVGRIDALPPGEYAVRVEPVRVDESLDMTGATATVRVDPLNPTATVNLTVLPRPLRIWIPPGRQGGTGTGGSGGGGTGTGRGTGSSTGDQ